MAEDAAASLPALYVIDTSALIDLRRDYPLRTFARLWQRFADLTADGRLIAPEEVRLEISRRDDELKRWTAGLHGLFRAPDAAFMDCLARVVGECPYLVPLDRRYAADSWVVALALEMHEAEQDKLMRRPCRVISHEERITQPGARLRIPNACDQYGLRCVRLVTVFVEEGWEGH